MLKIVFSLKEKGRFMEEYESNKKKMTAAEDALMANKV